MNKNTIKLSCFVCAIVVAGAFLLILYRKTWVLEYLFFLVLCSVAGIR